MTCFAIPSEISLRTSAHHFFEGADEFLQSFVDCSVCADELLDHRSHGVQPFVRLDMPRNAEHQRDDLNSLPS